MNGKYFCRRRARPRLAVKTKERIHLNVCLAFEFMENLWCMGVARTCDNEAEHTVCCAASTVYAHRKGQALMCVCVREYMYSCRWKVRDRGWCRCLSKKNPYHIIIGLSHFASSSSILQNCKITPDSGMSKALLFPHEPKIKLNYLVYSIRVAHTYPHDTHAQAHRRSDTTRNRKIIIMNNERHFLVCIASMLV